MPPRGARKGPGPAVVLLAASASWRFEFGGAPQAWLLRAKSYFTVTSSSPGFPALSSSNMFLTHTA
jgi:hypothetical protein